MKIDSDNFIFIVGCARTGSKLHADILNASSEINLVDELHFLAPSWVRKDFRSHYEAAGDLRQCENLRGLIDNMYCGKFSGTFWQRPPNGSSGSPPQTIFDIDRDELLNRFSETDRSLKSIFKCLIIMHAERLGKKRAGAKFPVDIGCIDTLMEWFPDAKYIHLIRDPRAIYASMVSMDKKYGFNLGNSIRKQGRPFKRLIYLVNRYKKAAQMHRRYADCGNYYVSSFEEMILNPKEKVASIVQFLNANYELEMLQPRIRSSSFGHSEMVNGRGFDADVVNRWKNHMPTGVDKLIEVALRSEMRLFGY